MGYNDINQAASLELIAAMKGKSMVSIGMASCELGVEGAKAMAELVSVTPSVTEVRSSPAHQLALAYTLALIPILNAHHCCVCPYLSHVRSSILVATSSVQRVRRCWLRPSPSVRLESRLSSGLRQGRQVGAARTPSREC